MRGIAEHIDAVVWFSDLRGFTQITDTEPKQAIPLLNDYSDAIFLAIHEHGGDVLKLIGDGTLAIFTAEDRLHACSAALSAAIDARTLRLTSASNSNDAGPTGSSHHVGSNRSIARIVVIADSAERRPWNSIIKPTLGPIAARTAGATSAPVTFHVPSPTMGSWYPSPMPTVTCSGCIAAIV